MRTEARLVACPVIVVVDDAHDHAARSLPHLGVNARQVAASTFEAEDFDLAGRGRFDGDVAGDVVERNLLAGAESLFPPKIGSLLRGRGGGQCE